jgi:FKBP-type peptidyl-prolyl cis-trans isomerase
MKKSYFTILSLCIALFSNAQDSVKSSSNGLLYQIFPKGGTEKVKIGDIVQYSTIQKFGDSVVRNSQEMGNFFVKLDSASIQQPLVEANIFPEMKVGDSAYVKIKTETIYSFLRTQGLADGDMLPFFTQKDKFVTLELTLLKTYQSDSLATVDFEKEKPKMMAYQQKMQQIEEEKRRAQGAIAEKTGAAFLAQNKTKPGIKTTKSGLQYQVLKLGKGIKPVKTSTVKVHYAGSFVNGKEFENSFKNNQPVEFGVTQVIAGWTEVLQLMPTGSKYKVFIPGNLAYGEYGKGNIGPNETLIFEIELLEVKNAAVTKPTVPVKPAPKKPTTTKPKTTGVKKSKN